MRPIILFPRRGPFSVHVVPEEGVSVEAVGVCWLVVARGHGWVYSSRAAALRDAHDLAAGFGVIVVSS